MWLNKSAHFLNIAVKPAAKAINYLGAAVLVSIMVLTGADVTLRYLFNSPITGSYELTEVLMVVIVAFGLAYCASEKGHVRVDLVVSRLPRRAQAVMNFIASLAFLSIFVIITWQSIYREQAMIEATVTTYVLFIPLFPFAFVVTVGSAILCLVLLAQTIEYLDQVVKK